jgi:internalin A
VADSRKEDTDFYYWLNAVELLSDNSPLLMILNEKQNRRREINERQLRGQFANLKETLPTNLADNRGLDRIREEIKHQMTMLPHAGASLPRTWVKVRQALENDPRNSLELHEYLDLCQRHGITEPQDKLQLSGYLHDLGVCLHFQDDKLLKKTIILKPEWATAAVYKVLDNPGVLDNLGRFTGTELAAIWRGPEYANRQDDLLQLMMKFKLCYEIPGAPGNYIAPQLLSENQLDYPWDETGNLFMRYTYEFMPKGILTRFIVEMHPWIADQELVWRSGVVLEKNETRAEVAEYYGQRAIKIRVAGKHRKELMTIVLHELDKIHASYHRLKYQKLIPCNCYKCRQSYEPEFYPTEVLQQFMTERQETIQCRQSFKMVAVRGLIDDVVDLRRFPALKRGETLGFEAGAERTEVFVSYSHNDKKWLERLQTHLKPLVREGIIDLWDDTRIKTGADWRKEIEMALDSAKGAILLISADFLASDFIIDNELPPLLEAAERQGCRIVPVIVGPCLVKPLKPLSRFQAINSPKRPLTKMKKAEQEELLVKVAEIFLEES